MMVINPGKRSACAGAGLVKGDALHWAELNEPGRFIRWREQCKPVVSCGRI